MNLQARPYRDPTDFVAMRQLLVAGTQAIIPASYMHPGCLDWDTHYPPDEEANRRNLYLWEQVATAPPTLAAWALFSRHEGTFDLFVSPALYGTDLHAAVMDEYLVWVEARARAAGLQQIAPFWAMAYDTVLVNLLQARGFVTEPVDPPAPLFARTLDDLPPLKLPAGFTVQGVGNLADGQLRHRRQRPNPIHPIGLPVRCQCDSNGSYLLAPIYDIG